MEPYFWHKKWKSNDIAFHASEANPFLVEYYNKLSLKKGSRVFLPLCGKTLDIQWLLSNGYHVVGAELSEIAIEQLFTELRLRPTIDTLEKLKHYNANNIDIFVGDIFDVSTNILNHIDAIYDRAALVALPTEMRNRYSMHLMEITQQAPQLLISYEYDQNLQEGPPFSVSNEEVKQHYQKNYDVILLKSIDVIGGLKGKCAAKENVWLLKSKQSISE